MKKSRFIPIDSYQETKISAHLCQHEGCEELGEYRAPKSPTNLQEHYWFCLDHVKEYNKAWDFYKGMSPEEIEASRISDVTWNRPSWPVGGWRALLENARYFDGIDPFLKVAPLKTFVAPEIQKALGILELELPFTIETLKKQYKKLAKKHHPDLHPDDKNAEDQLKKVNAAYQVLKKFLK